MALRSSGFKSKGKSGKKAEPDGIAVVSGRVKVRGKGYMAHLHQQQTPPLDLSPVMGDAPQFGGMELHHSRNADGASRRTDDSSVVPLLSTAHQWVEMSPVEERNLLGPLFGTWSAFSYWSYVRGLDPRAVGTGEQFRKEVLLWLFQEQESSKKAKDSD